MVRWQKIHETAVAHQATIIKAVLEDHDIATLIIDKQDSAYAIFSIYEIYVNAHDVIRAIKIIQDEINFE